VVYAWGSNHKGQLGIKDISEKVGLPVVVKDLLGFGVPQV